MKAMVAIAFVEDTLYELMQGYQDMREEGEHDMRTVIHKLDVAIKTIIDAEE
jgi:hypothetical protein